MHQAYDRPEEELYFKFKNWSHNNDFDVVKYFQFWKSINQSNYKKVKKFCPIPPFHQWKSLEFIKAQYVDELIDHFIKNPIKLKKSYIFKKNFIQFFLVVPFIKKLYDRLTQ